MKKNKCFFVGLIVLLSIVILIATKKISFAQEGPWRIPIKALGQGEDDGLSGANNASTIFIGENINAETYQALFAPPSSTSYITLLGQSMDLSEDIKKIGTGRQVWFVNLKIGSYADPNLPGYYPELIWDPNHEIVNQDASMELRRGHNEEGELLADMTATTTYETQEADGTYSPIWDMTFLYYTIIYEAHNILGV